MDDLNNFALLRDLMTKLYWAGLLYQSMPLTPQFNSMYNVNIPNPA